MERPRAVAPCGPIGDEEAITATDSVIGFAERHLRRQAVIEFRGHELFMGV